MSDTSERGTPAATGPIQSHSRALRIVHVIEGLHPNRGGPPVVAMSLAAAQVRLGHDVTIVCEEPGSRPDGVDALIRFTRDGERVRIERVPIQRRFSSLHGTFRDVTKAFATPPSLVHLHGVWNPIVMVGGRTAGQLKAPYVISTHGALHPDVLAIGALKKRAALALGRTRLLRNSRKVLCLNVEEEHSANRIAGRVVGRIVAATLPNGVDLLSVASPAPGAFRNTFAPLHARPYFVFFGRLDRVKGLDALLDAYLLCRSAGSQADLVFVGPDWGEQAAITAAAAAAGIGAHVHFAGALYDERKYAALKDAIALVHRPRYEGFGLAVIEAMAVQTPGVIGERCLLPVSGEADGVVIVRGDARAFAQAMLDIETNPARREALGAAATACVRERFDWTAIAVATLAAAGVA
ncbi:MAG: glycosyltransferase [Phycisphaerae bacterium]|nr:glycosyltransferase [Phycisphaerae bacterium]